MSIVLKGDRRKYAYLASREGRKVVHRYLGPADNPRVKKIISDRNEARRIPEGLRTLFWDTRIENIHIKNNARYIIERVLEMGDLDALRWLQRVYPVRTIIDVIETSRVLTGKSRNFWRIWFEAEDA